MAATPSTMLPLGTPLPDFELADVTTGRPVSSTSLRGAVSIVAFVCNHCPYVQHIRRGLADLGRYCQSAGVNIVAVSSNDIEAYPQDGPGPMAEEAKRAGYTFSYLFDETQSAAKAFRAACTPEFYVFDRDGMLAYRGQFDDARPKNDVPVTGKDVRAAVAALLRGERPNAQQTPSIGCSIKWKRGNAPSYLS